MLLTDHEVETLTFIGDTVSAQVRKLSDRKGNSDSYLVLFVRKDVANINPNMKDTPTTPNDGYEISPEDFAKICELWIKRNV